MGKKEKLGTLSGAEFQVLTVLWESGACTVRDVQNKLSNRAYTTVQTLLTRLKNKGYVTCDTCRFAHVFRPAVSRDRLIRRRLSDIVHRLSSGAAAPLVLALIEDHRFSPEEMEQFIRLLDRTEAKRQPEAKEPETPRKRRHRKKRPR